MRFASAVVASALLLSVGCAPRGPIAGAVVPEGTGGTIAGIVSANDGSTALTARRVTAINTATGARFETSTASNGGYTIKVPSGTYRLEVEVRAGETVTKQPDTTQVNVGDLDADRNFVVGVGK
jgi:Carboxypeptidase regulatory-like domain